LASALSCVTSADWNPAVESAAVAEDGTRFDLSGALDGPLLYFIRTVQELPRALEVAGSGKGLGVPYTSKPIVLTCIRKRCSLDVTLGFRSD
jgi:hypothetical protein